MALSALDISCKWNHSYKCLQRSPLWWHVSALQFFLAETCSTLGPGHVLSSCSPVSGRLCCHCLQPRGPEQLWMRVCADLLEHLFGVGHSFSGATVPEPGPSTPSPCCHAGTFVPVSVLTPGSSAALPAEAEPLSSAFLVSVAKNGHGTHEVLSTCYRARGSYE